jgi:hypothetical protein
MFVPVDVNDVLPSNVMERIERLGSSGAFELYMDIVNEIARERPHVKEKYFVSDRKIAILHVKDSTLRKKRLEQEIRNKWALVQVSSTPHRDLHLLYYIRRLLLVFAKIESKMTTSMTE